jgi:hypothetical protein
MKGFLWHDKSHDKSNFNKNNDNIYMALKVVGLERGPLSLVSTTEELLDRKVTVPV